MFEKYIKARIDDILEERRCVLVPKETLDVITQILINAQADNKSIYMKANRLSSKEEMKFDMDNIKAESDGVDGKIEIVINALKRYR